MSRAGAPTAMAPRLPPSRREPLEIGDAEGRLEPRDLGDGVVEAVLAEELVLLLFELLTELSISRAAHDAAERGEQDRLLPCRVRPVHTAEAPQDVRELGRRRRRGTPDDVV